MRESVRERERVCVCVCVDTFSRHTDTGSTQARLLEQKRRGLILSHSSFPDICSGGCNWWRITFFPLCGYAPKQSLVY